MTDRSTARIIEEYRIHPSVDASRTIGEQNDQFRRGIMEDRHGIPGRLVATHGVTRLGGEFLRDAMRAVAAYGLFPAEDDPHGERNVGTFRLWTEQINWRIDLYDPDFRRGSDDCADIIKTQRVLTIMLASDA